MVKDWNHERYVTRLELEEMPRHESQWFLNQPKVWAWDPTGADRLLNLAHVDNVKYLARVLAGLVHHGR